MDERTASIGPDASNVAGFFRHGSACIAAGCHRRVDLGLLIFRKTATNARRKHRHHRGQRPLNPTLAETGGLPPVRDDQNPATHRQRLEP